STRTIPPGAGRRSPLRRRGRGIPRLGGRGRARSRLPGPALRGAAPGGRGDREPGVPERGPRDLERGRSRNGAGGAPGAEVSYRLVSIVLPVHRQADHISSVIEEFESRLATLGCPHETILVAN